MNSTFRFILSLAFAMALGTSFGQKLKNGTYRFIIRDYEYHGQEVGTCRVTIKGNRIKAIYTSHGLTNIQTGDVFDEGLLLWHRKTKQWIIGQTPKDAHAKEVGSCSGGPRVVDLKKKVIWHC
jgi:hypothetical protein